MEWERYKLVKNTDYQYEFYSEGLRGRLKKIIEFQPMKYLGATVFNLAFGNWNEITRRLDDETRTNNGDQLKIFQTVAEAVINFFETVPNAFILIQGSTSARTRLYQMRIAGFWSKISQQYEIQGELNNEWSLFRMNVNYKRFLIYKKIK
ncbi:MAG: hypothetical protein JST68_21170 [Bacteroidetes bacterium]|nr:hypothetical protein [Bacteroidota bacterium]